uniref:Uncharacterized protein n=1 Tax=Caenorhabditis japonica TaxID=281687 RepID=A0A8R1E1T4_CAEJA
MQSHRLTLGFLAILGLAYLTHGHPLAIRDASKSGETTEIALPGSSSSEVALPEATTTEVDTLGNTRVKRQGGGCGCGCGCCCCRPRCCCCCRRCCTCCRTCCCTRCCTCCRPCCCGCGGGGGCGCGCGCGGGCGGGCCGCCGCGGGGRKRRSLQALKNKLAEKVLRETTVTPVEEEKEKPEEVETATEWKLPEPVYELVTDAWAH